MDRPLCSFAVRLALPVALSLCTGCGQTAPEPPAAFSAPAKVSHVVLCAADGPELASPAGKQAVAEEVIAGSNDPRQLLRGRLRKLQEVADEPADQDHPSTSDAPKAESAKQDTSKPETAAEHPAGAKARATDAPVALEAPAPVPCPELRPVPQAAAESPTPRAQVSIPIAQPAPQKTAQQQPPSSDESPQIRLPWADRPIHSAAMEAVTRQAEECTQHAYELASRGATFSARAELIRALRLIAQALDAQYDTRNHGKALAAGLRALSEADDFIPRSSQIEAEMNVPLLVSSHQTPVLKEESMQGVTPLGARQRYYTYAQEQLGAAAGREPAGSTALYALGKIQTTLTTAMDSDDKSADPKSIVYYRAALTVDGTNYLAANDLGVLLARFGMVRDARSVLAQSLSVSPQSVTWRNLAIVHTQLGEKELAARAQNESQVLASQERQGQRAAGPDVQWMTPEAFANAKAPAQVDTVQQPKDTAAKAPTTTRK